MAGSNKIRYIRVRTVPSGEDESQPQDSPLPDAGASEYSDLEDEREGDGVYYDEECGVTTLKPSSLHTHHSDDSQDELLQPTQSRRSRWTRRRRIPPLFRGLICGRRRKNNFTSEKPSSRNCDQRQRPLRFILKSLAIILMLL